MKINLPASKIILFIFLIAAFAVSRCSAHTNDKDSCLAMMMIMPDNNDPLLMHFYFTGNVPVGSFSFLGLWDFGDGNLSNDSCPDHQYSLPGTYTVCLSFNICIGGGMSCHDDTCETITIGTMSGIENTTGTIHSFYTYPNPAMTEFHVRSDVNKNLEMKISDFSGRVLMNKIIHNDEPIDAASLSKGIYYINISDGNRSVIRKLDIQK